MADNLRDATIIARGGLYTNEDALTLAATQPGAAIRLTNFEISQFGGYRRMNGYTAFDSSNPTVPGTGAVLGLWIHQDRVYAARRNAVDSTSAVLPVGAITVTTGSTTVTVVSTSHGLSTGELVSFTNVSTLGSLTLTGKEFAVATVSNFRQKTLRTKFKFLQQNHVIERSGSEGSYSQLIYRTVPVLTMNTFPDDIDFPYESFKSINC